jgi:hypothetical protein
MGRPRFIGGILPRNIPPLRPIRNGISAQWCGPEVVRVSPHRPLVHEGASAGAYLVEGHGVYVKYVVCCAAVDGEERRSADRQSG